MGRFHLHVIIHLRDVCESRGTALPPLSCGEILDAAAVTVDESGSAAGKVLLLGGCTAGQGGISKVRLVDMATGVCTPQPNLLCACETFAGASFAREDLVAITSRCRYHRQRCWSCPRREQQMRHEPSGSCQR
jgi:hypothetical protein